MAMGFAHKAGLAPHPGKYTGPAVTPPEDWTTKQDQYGAEQEADKDVIENVSEGGNAPIILERLCN